MSRLFPVFVVFVASLLTAGAAQAEVKVLTSIKPLQLIAAAVQDGVAVPEVLLPPGASPHNYALRPSDVRRVQSVDLLYWIGPDMEGFLPRVLKGRSLPTVAVQDLPGMKLRRFAEDSHSHADDADEHDHDHRPGSSGCASVVVDGQRPGDRRTNGRRPQRRRPGQCRALPEQRQGVR